MSAAEADDVYHRHPGMCELHRESYDVLGSHSHNTVEELKWWSTGLQEKTSGSTIIIIYYIPQTNERQCYHLGGPSLTDSNYLSGTVVSK